MHILLRFYFVLVIVAGVLLCALGHVLIFLFVLNLTFNLFLCQLCGFMFVEFVIGVIL